MVYFVCLTGSSIDGPIAVKKSDLRSQCSFLADIFISTDVEYQQVFVMDEWYYTFGKFIGCIKGETIQLNDAGAIFELADKYAAFNICNMCLDFMSADKITEEVIIEWANLATGYDIPSLMKVCEGYVWFYPNEAFRSSDFIYSTVETIKFFLRTCECSYTSRIQPMVVFENCVEWAKNQCDNNETVGVRAIRLQLEPFWHLLPFAQMTAAERESCRAYFEIFVADLQIFALWMANP